MRLDSNLTTALYKLFAYLLTYTTGVHKYDPSFMQLDSTGTMSLSGSESLLQPDWQQIDYTIIQSRLLSTTCLVCRT